MEGRRQAISRSRRSGATRRASRGPPAHLRHDARHARLPQGRRPLRADRRRRARRGALRRRHGHLPRVPRRLRRAGAAHHRPVLPGPYGILVPQGMDNLLVAGRCVAGDKVSHAATRSQMCCAVTGQAAGQRRPSRCGTGEARRRSTWPPCRPSFAGRACGSADACAGLPAVRRPGAGTSSTGADTENSLRSPRYTSRASSTTSSSVVEHGAGGHDGRAPDLTPEPRPRSGRESRRRPAHLPSAGSRRSSSA